MTKSEKRALVPVYKKAMLTLEEASVYTGIGVNKLRTMTNEPDCDYVAWIGTRRVLKREKLKAFLEQAYYV